MRLNECDLDGIAGVVAAPFQRKEPEEDWLIAEREGMIPASLYSLYRRANYLSFGSSPKFLADDDNLLFSYFGLSLRSIMESLVDADIQVTSFIKANDLAYDPVKKMRGEPWGKDATKRANRHFRDLLIALSTSLDALSDVIAIFFPGAIKGLEVGRAQFSKIELWLMKALVNTKLIVSPTEFFVKQLYDTLQPLINASGPQTDWLPLMRLLRNKAAHLGTPLFRQLGLSSRDGQQVAFIPREWPYLWEQLIKPRGHVPKVPMPQLLRETLIHQDIVSYAKGLLAKVNSVVAAAIEILNEAYERFREFPQDQAALMQLKGNFEHYNFENFDNA